MKCELSLKGMQARTGRTRRARRNTCSHDLPHRALRQIAVEADQLGLSGFDLLDDLYRIKPVSEPGARRKRTVSTHLGSVELVCNIHVCNPADELALLIEQDTASSRARLARRHKPVGPHPSAP